MHSTFVPGLGNPQIAFNGLNSCQWIGDIPNRFTGVMYLNSHAHEEKCQYICQ